MRSPFGPSSATAASPASSQSERVGTWGTIPYGMVWKHESGDRDRWRAWWAGGCHHRRGGWRVRDPARGAPHTRRAVAYHAGPEEGSAGVSRARGAACDLSRWTYLGLAEGTPPARRHLPSALVRDSAVPVLARGAGATGGARRISAG